MGLFSLANLFGITLRESANDGSDFTNPDADYRRVYLGEDALLHLKDSAGAVTFLGSGTAFPTATTGARFFRTDLRMEFFYDGTRWLSTFQRTLTFDTRLAHAATGLAATSTLGNAAMPNVDIYVEDFRVVAFASAGAFDGSNFWTMTLDKLTLANASTTIGTLTMNSQTSNNWKVWEVAIDAVVALSAHVVFRLVATKTASAPNLFLGSEVTYRLIAT